MTILKPVYQAVWCVLLLLAGFTASAQTLGILYSRAPDGVSNGTMWVAISDGSYDQPIAQGEWPRISPDGSLIVFHRGAGSDPVRQDIYVLNLLTGDATRVFANNDFAVSYDWTADSSQIVFDYGCGIYLMNNDGSNMHQILGADCFDDAPTVNPIDGSIAFHNLHLGILRANLDGSSRTVVPNTLPSDLWPQWSPYGQWISFGRTDINTFIVNYFIIRRDGTDLTQLTFQSPSDPDRFGPIGPWTADGSALIVPGTIGGVNGIYAIATGGSGTVTLLPTSPGANVDFVGSVANQ